MKRVIFSVVALLVLVTVMTAPVTDLQAIDLAHVQTVTATDSQTDTQTDADKSNTRQKVKEKPVTVNDGGVIVQGRGKGNTIKQKVTARAIVAKPQNWLIKTFGRSKAVALVVFGVVLVFIIFKR